MKHVTLFCFINNFYLELNPFRNCMFCMDILQEYMYNTNSYITITISHFDRSDVLRSGHFEFGDSEIRKQVGTSPFSSVKLPLAIAATTGATHSIKALLQAGVCPKQVDCHGNNVVHSMIAFLYYHSEMDEAIISTFQLLVNTLSVDVMREILHYENSFGLRPIEFAAQHGQGSMVLAIMNTPGVYLIKQQKHGLDCYKWYNITEYENTGSNSRWFKSPLLLMTYVDTKLAASDGYSDFITCSAIQAWLTKRTLVNLPLLLIRCVFRITFILFYMMLSLDMSMADTSSNSTACVPDTALILPPDARFGMLTSMMVIVSISLLLDIVDFVQLFLPFTWPQRRMISRKKNILPQASMYRICHFFLCLFLLICSPLMFGYPYPLGQTLVSYSQIVNPVLAGWSTLYVMQLIPSFGFFIISVYSMVKNLGSLFVLFMLMNLPFIQAFYTFLNSNTLQGCIRGFGDPMQTFYSTFLMILNMVSITELNVKDSMLLYMTHVLFTFAISILLINFLVAVMSDTMSNISQGRDYIETIQRSSVVYTLENHVKWFLKPYYNFMNRKMFFSDQGEILLIDSISVPYNRTMRQEQIQEYEFNTF